MIQAMSGEVAGLNRRSGKSSNGEVRWYTDFLGKLVQKVEEGPQSHLTEMDAHQTIVPHFHQVDQFQVMVGGTGSIGRNPLPLVALHYADRHTAYGPINAGPYGLSLFTIRAQSDPGAIYLHQSDYKTYLKPSKKRYLIAENIALSADAVLENRKETVLESVLEKDVDVSDGLGAFMLRGGAGARTAGPDPKVTGGQYYLVLKGGLSFGGGNYPAWSTVYLEPNDGPLDLRAGRKGLEALVLNFPRREG